LSAYFANPLIGKGEDMEEILQLHLELRDMIRTESRVMVNLCYTCGACDSGCPMNMATGLLMPRKLVWMANLGLFGKLLNSSEIWYCIMCNHCTNNCPMTVKPSDLISYLRWKAVKEYIVLYENVSHYRSLMSKFQRLRWHMADACIKSGYVPDLEQNLSVWMEKKIELSDKTINLNETLSASGWFPRRAANCQSCFTCGECSSTCPISVSRDIFDPVWIFRMANLGLLEELANSPSIWLCLGCQRCTQACSQGVRGHELIQDVREFALAQGILDQGFLNRWMQSQQKLNKYLKYKIDQIFG